MCNPQVLALLAVEWNGYDLKERFLREVLASIEGKMGLDYLPRERTP